MNQSQQPPLSYHDLKSLGDPGAAIAQHRAQGQPREIDWSRCGLVAMFGLPGEPGHERTSRRRRTLVA